MNELHADPLIRYQQLRDDPWLFLKYCVKTLDQADPKTPIKPYPSHYQYLELYTKIWARYPLIAVPKSRRMVQSWTNIGLLVHSAIFFKGRAIAMVSKKEDDAAELIERAVFIVKHIPQDILPKELIPKWKHTFCHIDFPETQTYMQGFPQGADQLRQFTFSHIFGDECAFWENAEDFYSASFPTIEGGGRMTLVSSPAPGFFKNLVFDKLDGQEPPPITHEFPIEGVEVWKNSKNKFMVFQLHFKAHPGKTSDVYRDSLKESMPIRKFMQEYDLVWDSFTGLPVYADFNRTIHAPLITPKPEVGLQLLLGFDFGLTPACVVGQLQGEQLIIFREFQAFNMGTKRFCNDIVLPGLRQEFPEWSDLARDFICFMDPAGINRDQSNENSCMLELASVGFKPRPSRQNWEDRRSSVDKLLTKITKKGASLVLNPHKCHYLLKGFEGGYRYAEHSENIEPTKIRPLKDEHSHIHDALQYLCAGILRGTKTSGQIKIPVPQYSLTAPRGNQGQIKAPRPKVLKF